MTVLLVVACSVPTPPASGPETWIDRLAEHPEHFEDQMARDGRPAWIDLHAGRLEAAYDGMQTDAGRHRAARDLARFYGALARTHRTAANTLAKEWPDAPGEVAAIGAYAATCASPPAGPLADRAETQPQLDARPDTPAWTLEANGFERALYDPCHEHRVTEAWEARMGPVEGLADQLFGGIALELVGDRTPQGARDDAMHIRRNIEQIVARHPDEGVLAGLAVAEIAAVHTAVDHAEQALKNGDADFARLLLTLAEPAGSEGIGPTRPPLYFAVLARAELEANNPRGALDALSPLGPVATGVRETVSDLAVLRGLSRSGDNREE